MRFPFALIKLRMEFVLHGADEMTIMNKTMRGVIGSKLALDPKQDKEFFKEKITRSILDQVAGATREDVYQEVHEGYERLLERATITMHIPVLVEGEVRAQERKKYRQH
jgi:hypothetical protein